MPIQIQPICSVRRSQARGVAAVVLALSCGVDLRAQEPKAMSDLVAEAEWIAVADLVDTSTRRDTDSRLIVTDYHFSKMQTVLDGPPSAEFTLTQPGGTLDGEMQMTEDTPAFVIGGRYLLFVRDNLGAGQAPFVGGAQGVYRISIDGKAMPLGGIRTVLERDELLAEVEQLVVVARGPQAKPKTVHADVRAGAGR